MKLCFGGYDIKNRLRIKYNYRMNQITNTFLNKEYKPKCERLASKQVMKAEEANVYISNLIESGKPFWVEYRDDFFA